MGVYIKDMTLEEFSEYGDYCQTLIGTGQAEEVPPHGRLIDADALAAKCDDPHWCVWLSEIEDAPTIIPAEEGET